MLTAICLIMQFATLGIAQVASDAAISSHIYLALSGILFACFALDLACDTTLGRFRQPLLAGLLLRILLYIWNQVIIRSAVGDQEGFFVSASQNAAGIQNNYGGMFTRAMGLLFRITGCSKEYGTCFILLFSMLSIVVMIRIFQLLKLEPERVLPITWIVALLPNFAMLGSEFLRESPMQLTNGISVFFFVKWLLKDGKNLHLITAIGLALVSSRFHSGNISLVIAYIFVLMLYDKRTCSFSFTVGNVSAAIALFLIVFVVVRRNPALFTARMQDIDSLDDISKGGIVRGGSSYSRYVGNSSSISSFLLYSPLRIIYFLLSPLPWTWRGFGDVLAFVGSSSFYLASMFRSVTRMHGNDEHSVLLKCLFICSIAAAFVFGWGVTNAGTALRHRDKFVVLWAVILALASNRHEKNAKTKND